MAASAAGAVFESLEQRQLLATAWSPVTATPAAAIYGAGDNKRTIVIGDVWKQGHLNVPRPASTGWHKTTAGRFEWQRSVKNGRTYFYIRPRQARPGVDSGRSSMLQSETLNATILYTPTSAAEGDEVYVEADPGYSGDPDALYYEWYAYEVGQSTPIADSTDPWFSFIPDDNGGYRITLNVTDGQISDSAEETFTVTNVAPTATLAIGGPDATTLTNAGTLTFSGPGYLPSVLQGTGEVSVGGAVGLVRVSQQSVSVSANAVLSLGGAGPTAGSRVNTLTLAGTVNAWTGTVDLGDGRLIVQSTSVDLAADFARIRNQVWEGANIGGTYFAGNGIRSSVAAAHSQMGVGYARAADLGVTSWGGSAVDANSILVRYTYLGDADLDGDVDGNDVARWSQGYSGELGGNGPRNWSQGDWDYDGDVDGNDVGKWAVNFTGDWGGGGIPMWTAPAGTLLVEGAEAVARLANPADPSSADFGAGLRYSFALSTGNLATTYAGASSANLQSMGLLDDETTVYGRIFDKDNGSRTYTGTVQSANQMPLPTITGLPASADEGQRIELEADPGHMGDPEALSYEWAVYKNGGGTAFATGDEQEFAFTPDDNGSFRIVLTVTDADGAAATTQKAIAVTNVAPVLGPVASRVVNLDDSVSLVLPFTDAGTGDVHTALVDWGDSTIDSAIVIESEGSGDISASHHYHDLGSRTVTITLTDDDGANVIQSFGVVVTADPPAQPTQVGVTGAAYCDGVALQWQDNSASEDGYLVEWSDDGIEYFVIDELPADATSYLDEYPTLGNQHYRIRSFRGNEVILQSDPTSPLSVHPIAPPVAWGDNNAGANDRNTLSPFATRHDTPVTIDVLPNDIDYEGQAIWVAGHTDPAHGAVTLNADDTFTYAPDPGFTGTDTFTYTLTDGIAESSAATISIDVTNNAPTAQSQERTYTENRQVVRDGIVYSNVIEGFVAGNDPDGDSLTYSVVSLPAHGTLLLDSSTGAFMYSAGTGYFGIDRFTFATNDGMASSLPAPVTINDHNPLIGRNHDQYVTPGSQVTVFGADARYLDPIVVPGHGPSNGTITRITNPITTFYTPNPGYVGRDSAQFVYRRGNIASKPFTIVFHVGEGCADPMDWTTGLLTFGVSGDTSTPFGSGTTGWVPTWAPPSVKVAKAQDPAHGSVTIQPDGSFQYFPDGEYRGWDAFAFVYEGTTCNTAPNWVTLDVGYEYAPPPASSVPPTWFQTPTSFGATFSELTAGYDQALGKLTSLNLELAELGTAVGNVGSADDDQIVAKIDLASEHIDSIATKYDQYLGMVAGLQQALGTFLAGVFYTRESYQQLAMKIIGLPTQVGSLSPSRQKMQELANAAAEMGRGAAIAVDTANKVVKFAEDAHAVCSTVEMAGGVSVLVKTGATLLVKEGIKACAKQAAKEFMQEVASSVAAEMANYAAMLCGFTEEQKQWLRVGVDAYQTFAFLKAARVKVPPGGVCFAAGTQVVTGINADGSLASRHIEDIRVGDVVLSRNQYDAGDGPDARVVTGVFRNTSDHVRVLRIDGDGGNIETIRTTDSHPFYAKGRGWTEASALRIGDLVQETDGTWQTVLTSTRETYPEGLTVYNLEVSGDHTYFVEDGHGKADAIWVHNSCFRDDVMNSWSQKLGRRLGNSYQAHHTVPENDSRAAGLRTMLESVGIGINHKCNGVPLRPSEHQRYIHGFSDDYVMAIEDRIGDKVTQGQAAVMAELEKIGNEIFTGAFQF